MRPLLILRIVFFMNDTKIMYCGKFIFPDRNAAANRAVTTCRMIHSQGFSIHLMGEGSIEFEKEEYEICCDKTLAGWLEYAIFPFTILKRLIFGGYRLVILYDYPALPSFLIFLVCRLFKTRLAMELTEWYQLPAERSFVTMVKAADVFLRMRVIPRICDGFIVANAYLAEILPTKGKPVLELPTLFSDLEAIQINTPRGKEDEFHIVYAGNPFDSKSGFDRTKTKERLDLVVEVVTAINEKGFRVFLTVFGVEEAIFLQFYPELTAEVQGANIVFKGRVDRKEVVEAVASADFSIFFREITRVSMCNFPSKFSESIALGTPVITNFVPSFSKYCKPETTIVCETLGSVHEMADMICKFLKRSDIERMKAACLSQRADFLIASYVDNVKSFLAAVLARN